MIKAENLVKRYGSNYALNDVSFEIGEGEIVGLLGPNGAGKSTAMNILTGYLSATSGSVSINGVDILEHPIDAKKNIGFICMKPLAGGAIDDPITAIRFAVSNPDVTVVIPGMADFAEIKQNVSAASDTSPLRIEEQEKIIKIKESLGTNFCRRCNYCAPCTAGINIPSVFLLEGYFSRYDLKEWAIHRYSQLDKNASDCTSCGACEARCPYNLPIRQMLKNAAKVMTKR